MRNADEVRCLAKLTLVNRVLVMSVLERIEEEILYNNKNCEGVAIRINLKKVFYSVFATEKIKGKMFVVGWNEKISKLHPNLEAPEVFYQKTWKKIVSEAIFTSMGIALDTILTGKGYTVRRSMSDPENPYIEIGWEEA
ncbi:MAG: hypothetical protein IKE01_02455 [Clostridia bacterium]|nr:hypothetical protein [Clostridia bacterium]